jgi:hypothetical protein
VEKLLTGDQEAASSRRDLVRRRRATTTGRCDCWHARSWNWQSWTR